MSTPLPWLAPHRTEPFEGSILVPGSKSLTNRALVLAALGDRPSTLARPLRSRDTNLMVSALTALGAKVRQDGMEWVICPIGTAEPENATIECGLAGTVMRFVPAIAALSNGEFRFEGDEHASARPMGTTIESLRQLGVTIDDGGRNTLPFTVKGVGEVEGGPLEVDASQSSQFISALLLAAPRFSNGLDLRHVGESMPSQPHVDMTVNQLRLRGIEIDTAPGHWQVPNGVIESLDVDIEPDLSNAGPFIAAALVTGGSTTIKGWPTTTDQAGDRWREITEAFGGTTEWVGEDLVFTAGESLRGVELDLRDVGELTPVVAAVAALAETPSRLTGIAHLRGHETNRLAALTTEINRLGGAVTELDDGLAIEPRPLNGDTFLTYDDHRMAHAAVVLGLRVPELLVENVVTTTKTFPNFAPVWERAMTEA